MRISDWSSDVCSSDLRNEEGVRLRPAIAHRRLVDHLEGRQLVVEPQGNFRADGKELLVGGDVFPEVAEVLGGEGMAVRPAMPLAQLQGETAAVQIGRASCRERVCQAG